MGGKSGTTTSSVSIPPEVLARYNSVNSQAQSVAATPFQQYSTDPNAFVAPVNQQQYAGVGGINTAANLAQPYYQGGAQMTLAGSQAANPQALQTQQYLSPYLNTVLGATAAQEQNQNAQQSAALTGNNIMSGAFGGDRAGVAQANLANQQNLANSQTNANIMNTGYNQALATAAQQQGVNLSAEQQNLARLQAGGNQLANLGAGAQGAALAGAQAQLGAGTMEQQTQQAGLSALYNQFQQQQAYPFQVAQFLANIAEGTGALSGSTTTTTSPMSFFSDERLKENIKTVGETFDGQKIYSYNYKGDPRTQIGLMAQNVEKKHPEAVGIASGYKTVNYKKATEDAAKRGHFYSGGVASQGGGVMPHNMFEGFAAGGAPIDLAAIQASLPTSSPSTSAEIANAQSLAPVFKAPAAATSAPINYFAQNAAAPSSPSTTNPFSNQKNATEPLINQFQLNNHDYNPNGGPVAPTYGGYSGIPETSPEQDNSPDSSQRQARGGGIMPRHGYALNGAVVSNTEGYDGGLDSGMGAMLASQEQMYAPGAMSGIYGHSASSLPGGKGVVPAASLPVGKLMLAQPQKVPQDNVAQELSAVDSAIKSGKDIFNTGVGVKNWAANAASPPPAATNTGIGVNPDVSGSGAVQGPTDTGATLDGFAFGGVPRHHYASGGVMPYAGDSADDNDPLSDVVKSGEQSPAQLEADAKGMQSGTGSSSSGSGIGALGSIASLGSDILSILPFASGGVASGRHGYATDGGVSDSDLAYVAQNDNTPVAPDQPVPATNDNAPPSPPDYKAMAISAAQKAGINPDHYARLIGGESGYKAGNASIGDNGSSGGLLQFHVKGASDQYPNAGVGDQFLAEKYPDFYKNSTPQQRVAFLADPKNQPEILDYGAQYIKQNGAGAWTQAHAQGLFGLDKATGVNSGQSAQASSPPPAGGVAPPSSQTGSWWDKLTSSDLIVPVLSGLGAMASSPSRYFGAALLQGLGGGAQAYQAQQNTKVAQQQRGQELGIQQQGLGIRQQEADISRTGKLAELANTWRSTNLSRQLAGLPPVEFSDFLSQQGATGLLNGASAPTLAAPPSVGASTTNGSGGVMPQAAPAQSAQPNVVNIAKAAGPVAGYQAGAPVNAAGQQLAGAPATATAQPAASQSQTPTATPSPVEKQIVQSAPSANDPFWSKVPDTQNIWKLQQQIQAASLYPEGRELSQRLRDDYNKILDRGVVETVNPDGSTTMMEIPGVGAAKASIAAQAANATKLGETRIAMNSKVYEEAANEAKTANEELQSANAQRDALFDEKGQPKVSMGPFSNNFNDFAAYFQELGVPENVLKDFGANPAATQAAEKIRTSLGTQFAKTELGTAPRVAEFNRYLSTVTGPQLLPGAFDYIYKLYKQKADASQSVFGQMSKADLAKDDLLAIRNKAIMDNPWYTPGSGQSAFSNAAQPSSAKVGSAPRYATEQIAAARAELLRRQQQSGVQ